MSEMHAYEVSLTHTISERQAKSIYPECNTIEITPPIKTSTTSYKKNRIDLISLWYSYVSTLYLHLTLSFSP